MLAVSESYRIPFQPHSKPYIPEGIEEAFSEAEKATPSGEFFYVNSDRIVEKNVKIGAKTVIEKYSLPEIKAIAFTFFGTKFDVGTSKSTIVEYLRQPHRFNEIKQNAESKPIPKPSGKPAAKPGPVPKTRKQVAL